VTNPASRRLRAAEVCLLASCALCCVWVAMATASLDEANARRRVQLSFLAQQLVQPERAPVGPIAALDGLFERRLQRVATLGGPMIAFVARSDRDRP
jgi:hypothetical protein